VAGHGAPEGPRATARFRDLTVTVMSLVCSVLVMWYSRNVGSSSWIYWPQFFMAGAALVLNISIYRRQRKSTTWPEEVPEYR
jgi:APA family basic amino acid/polyamine antiporter